LSYYKVDVDEVALRACGLHRKIEIRGDMMDQDALKIAIKTIADKYWETNQQPILLSEVGPILMKEAGGVDYRTLLDGKSLKVFIRDTGGEHGYRLVEHPTQGAKVALAPLSSKFEFTVIATEKLPKKSDAIRRGGNKVAALLEILSALPEEELAKISIPVSALVKLLK
jgi:hypothetical protein